MWSWESDIVVVSKSDLIAEYEIKVSISDYKRDFKKRKHQFLKYNSVHSGPSRFIYALPGSLAEKASKIEIPDHAGLYLVHRYQIQVIKKPPLLHKQKITDHQVKKLFRSLHYKAWDSMNTLTQYRIAKGMQKK